MKQAFYFAAGIGMLALSKAAYHLRGYVTPRPKNSPEDDIAYGERVVGEWLQAGANFTDRDVLELGPGDSKHIPALILGAGAHSYAGFDANPLREDYDSGPFSHRSRPDFDLSRAYPGRKFSMFVSQAAFEHFDSPDLTINQLSEMAAPDARLIFSIDLRTHGRWIRDKDPLNIYRYSDWLYDKLTYRGSPNRMSMSQYIHALQANGWTVGQVNVTSVEPDYFNEVKGSLHKSFRRMETQHVWIVIQASRK